MVPSILANRRSEKVQIANFPPIQIEITPRNQSESVNPLYLMLYDSFVRCLTHLVAISDRIEDGWTKKSFRDRVYLVKSVTQTLKTESDDFISSDSLDAPVDEQSADVPCLTVRKWEYHVLYNFSYNVPVLYFNVWKSSGELLTLDELWQSVNPGWKKQVLGNKWFTLTQQEHPYLFKPFFYFHPCDTGEFIECFSDEESNTLITWLSSIGQIIWLEMDDEYGKLQKFSTLMK